MILLGRDCRTAQTTFATTTFLPLFHYNDFIHCRTLFGGSVGPNRKQMPNGTTEQHYDGVRVRAQPLPLRIPPQALPQPQPIQPRGTPSVIQVTPAMPQPQSPILTNLLHRKSPVPDAAVKDQVNCIVFGP